MALFRARLLESHLAFKWTPLSSALMSCSPRFCSGMTPDSWPLVQLTGPFFFFNFLILIFFYLAHSTWKFPDQILNPSHSGDLSYCSDNAECLTCCASRELLIYIHINKLSAIILFAYLNLFLVLMSFRILN